MPDDELPPWQNHTDDLADTADAPADEPVRDDPADDTPDDLDLDDAADQTAGGAAADDAGAGDAGDGKPADDADKDEGADAGRPTLKAGDYVEFTDPSGVRRRVTGDDLEAYFAEQAKRSKADPPDDKPAELKTEKDVLDALTEVRGQVKQIARTNDEFRRERYATTRTTSADKLIDKFNATNPVVKVHPKVGTKLKAVVMEELKRTLGAGDVEVSDAELKRFYLTKAEEYSDLMSDEIQTNARKRADVAKSTKTVHGGASVPPGSDRGGRNWMEDAAAINAAARKHGLVGSR